jgi:hypothetical protein
MAEVRIAMFNLEDLDETDVERASPPPAERSHFRRCGDGDRRCGTRRSERLRPTRRAEAQRADCC